MTITTTIEVAPLSGRQPSGFGHLRLFHHGCEEIELVKHRNVLTNEYTVQCLCGLVIRLPAVGPAADAFAKTALDQQARPLLGSSYSSSVEGVLEVIGTGAA